LVSLRSDSGKQWSQAFEALKPGDAARLTIASGGTDREATIPLSHKIEQTYHMKAIGNPTPLQAKILQGFMKQE
jgi:hypothetical protein